MQAQNIQPQTQLLDPIAKFIFEHYWGAVNWTQKELMDWLEWAAAHGFLISVNKGDEVVGAGIARPVSELPDGDWYSFDLEGDIIHLDIVVAPSWEARRALWEGMIILFGNRPFVALRNKKDKVKVHKTEKAMKALFRREI